MSSTIQFIEAMGRNAQARHMSDAEYEAAIDALALDEAEAGALKARDRAVLRDLLGGRASMMCMIWAPDKQPDKQDEQPQEADVPEEEAPPAEE
ncbi:hypothetical protein [Pseudoxanthomonas putridarboris]|uniref:Uncharacterized protein n=1 Tax=Pseudoxanthomonas putridarboris TaxID=752605 RepID=A0ABU9J0C5_9GAMM